ncbi:Ig-like domain-containing protein, partial [Paenibacillus montaniterrae]
MYSARSRTKTWHRFIILTLAFMLIIGTLPASLIYAAEGEETPVEPSAPGGVSASLISWVDVVESAIKDTDDMVIKLQDLADDRTWNATQNSKQPYKASTINFNPGITINSSSGYFSTSAFGTDDFEREIFSVQARDHYENPNAFPWELGSSYQNAKYGDGSQIVTSAFSTRSRTVEIDPSEYDLLKSRVLNIRSSNEEWALSLDGRQLEVDSANQVQMKFGNLGTYYIGAGHYSRFDGSISEVILFDRILTPAERQQVNSYLALKYGLTLKDENGNSMDYLASDGATEMWTAAENTGFGNRIAGIGKDDASALEQKQSKSQETGALVTIALGEEIAASNEENLNEIAADKSFLTISDNDGSVEYDQAVTIPGVPSDDLKRIAREFKVQKTANWVDTEITLQLDGIEERYNYYLLVDNSATKLNASGQVTLNSIQLEHGATFSFARVVKPAVPGGVHESQPVLWLKADEGLGQQGGLLTGWEDQSQDPINFTLDIPAGQETKTPEVNANGVNFNPSVTFKNNGVRIGHYPLSPKLIGDKPITFRSGYAVYKYPDGTASAGALVGAKDHVNNSTNGAIIMGGYGNDFTTGPGLTNIYDYFGTVNRTRHQLVNYEIAGTKTARVDGKAEALRRNNNFSAFTLTPVIGATNGGTDDWHGFGGDVAEIILYDQLTSGHAAKIETYLAVKYGITLNSGNSPYVATNDDIVWEVDGTYKHNIAGIGYDNTQGLNQKQSRSINAGIPQVAIGLGKIEGTNAANGHEFTQDGQYLIWGDNGKSLVFDVQIGDTLEYHAQRIWKVQNTNNVGAVQLAIPEDAILAGKKLLVSSSSDFSDATEYPLTISEINGIPHYVAENVSLEDGLYFTFSVIAPELSTVTLEDVTIDEQEIVLTFDKPITLSNLNGFTVTINEQPLAIASYVIDSDQTTLRLKPSKAILDTDTILVSYEKVDGNIKGLNGAPVHKFDMEADNKIAPIPEVTIIEPAEDTVFVSKPTITGTATPGSTVTVKIGEAEAVAVTVNEEGNWSYTPDNALTDGDHTVVVTATKDGKTNSDSKTIKVDTTLPVVDKTLLQAKANEIDEAISTGELKEEAYTEASWQALEEALTEAKAVLADPTATQ